MPASAGLGREILHAEEILHFRVKNLESLPIQDLECLKGFLFVPLAESFSSACLQAVRAMSAPYINGIVSNHHPAFSEGHEFFPYTAQDCRENDMGEKEKVKQQKVQERISKHIRDLGSPDQKVSARAEGYLLRWYGVRALEPLVAACSDANPQVRFRSAWVLASTHDSRAYETILQLTRDPDGFVRYDAVIALGILGDERAIAPLISLMLQPDEEHFVDGAAAMGLVRLGQSAIPALLEVLTHGPEAHQCAAASVLSSLKAEQAVASIALLLSSPEEDTRITGIEALAAIGTAECLALIKPLQSDAVPKVSENAAYWVRELEGKEV